MARNIYELDTRLCGSVDEYLERAREWKKRRVPQDAASLDGGTSAGKCEKEGKPRGSAQVEREAWGCSTSTTVATTTDLEPPPQNPRGDSPESFAKPVPPSVPPPAGMGGKVETMEVTMRLLCDKLTSLEEELRLQKNQNQHVKQEENSPTAKNTQTFRGPRKGPKVPTRVSPSPPSPHSQAIASPSPIPSSPQQAASPQNRNMKAKAGGLLPVCGGAQETAMRISSDLDGLLQSLQGSLRDAAVKFSGPLSTSWGGLGASPSGLTDVHRELNLIADRIREESKRAAGRQGNDRKMPGPPSDPADSLSSAYNSSGLSTKVQEHTHIGGGTATFSSAQRQSSNLNGPSTEGFSLLLQHHTEAHSSPDAAALHWEPSHETPFSPPLHLHPHSETHKKSTQPPILPPHTQKEVQSPPIAGPTLLSPLASPHLSTFPLSSKKDFESLQVPSFAELLRMRRQTPEGETRNTAAPGSGSPFHQPSYFSPASPWDIKRHLPPQQRRETDSHSHPTLPEPFHQIARQPTQQSHVSNPSCHIPVPAPDVERSPWVSASPSRDRRKAEAPPLQAKIANGGRRKEVTARISRVLDILERSEETPQRTRGGGKLNGSREPVSFFSGSVPEQQQAGPEEKERKPEGWRDGSAEEIVSQKQSKPPWNLGTNTEAGRHRRQTTGGGFWQQVQQSKESAQDHISLGRASEGPSPSNGIPNSRTRLNGFQAPSTHAAPSMPSAFHAAGRPPSLSPIAASPPPPPPRHPRLLSTTPPSAPPQNPQVPPGPPDPKPPDWLVSRPPRPAQDRPQASKRQVISPSSNGVETSAFNRLPAPLVCPFMDTGVLAGPVTVQYLSGPSLLTGAAREGGTTGAMGKYLGLPQENHPGSPPPFSSRASNSSLNCPPHSFRRLKEKVRDDQWELKRSPRPSLEQLAERARPPSTETNEESRQSGSGPSLGSSGTLSFSFLDDLKTRWGLLRDGRGMNKEIHTQRRSLPSEQHEKERYGRNRGNVNTLEAERQHIYDRVRRPFTLHDFDGWMRDSTDTNRNTHRERHRDRDSCGFETDSQSRSQSSEDSQGPRPGPEDPISPRSISELPSDFPHLPADAQEDHTSPRAPLPPSPSLSPQHSAVDVPIVSAPGTITATPTRTQSRCKRIPSPSASEPGLARPFSSSVYSQAETTGKRTERRARDDEHTTPLPAAQYRHFSSNAVVRGTKAGTRSSASDTLSHEAPPPPPPPPSQSFNFSRSLSRLSSSSVWSKNEAAKHPSKHEKMQTGPESGSGSSSASLRTPRQRRGGRRTSRSDEWGREKEREMDLPEAPDLGTASFPPSPSMNAANGPHDSGKPKGSPSSHLSQRAAPPDSISQDPLSLSVSSSVRQRRREARGSILRNENAGAGAGTCFSSLTACSKGELLEANSGGKGMTPGGRNAEAEFTTPSERDTSRPDAPLPSRVPTSQLNYANTQKGNGCGPRSSDGSPASRLLGPRSLLSLSGSSSNALLKIDLDKETVHHQTSDEWAWARPFETCGEQPVYSDGGRESIVNHDDKDSLALFL